MSEAAEHPGPFAALLDAVRLQETSGRAPERRTLPMSTEVCSHRWCIQIRYPVPIERFKKALDGMCFIGCPACGKYGEDVLVQDVLGGEYNR